MSRAAAASAGLPGRLAPNAAQRSMPSRAVTAAEAGAATTAQRTSAASRLRGRLIGRRTLHPCRLESRRMSTVNTVQGPVDASELGTTLIHEHVRFRDEAVAENWPGRYDADEEMRAAVEA